MTDTKEKTSNPTKNEAPKAKPKEISSAEKKTNKPADSTKSAVNYAQVRPGATVRVHQKIKDEGKAVKGKKETTKERIQVFEGIVLARHGRNLEHSTITVRKMSDGIGVEKIFPLALPTITKIEVARQAKVRRAKLYYLRTHGKKLKETAVAEAA